MTLTEALAPWLFAACALLLGLVVGSFANVVIHRWPRGESVVSPRSRCPGCARPIPAWENVPVLSYALLGGRCRGCRMRIAPRYPAVEAASGLAYGAIAVLEGPTPRGLATMAFVTAMLVLSLIDLDHQLLPDVITLPGIALGLAASVLPDSPVTPLAATGGAAGGYLAFWGVAAAYRRARQVEGLGQGDWKMAAMIGAFLGWERLLLTVFLAAVAGTLVGLALMRLRGRDSRHALPLGTFLGAAAVFVVFAGDPVLAWYKGLLRA